MARLMRIAAINCYMMILSYVAQHSLGLARSF